MALLLGQWCMLACAAPSTIRNPQSAISDQRSAISDQRSAIHGTVTCCALRLRRPPSQLTAHRFDKIL
jgi:hypothetical protein